METKHSYLLVRWLMLQGVEVVEVPQLSLTALFILISLGVGSGRALGNSALWLGDHVVIRTLPNIILFGSHLN